MKYKICTLDVWGNEKEGYEINDYFTIMDEVLIEDDESFNKCLSELLIGDVARYDIRDEFNGFIEVSYKDKPILHFYSVD